MRGVLRDAPRFEHCLRVSGRVVDSQFLAALDVASSCDDDRAIVRLRVPVGDVRIRTRMIQQVHAGHHLNIWLTWLARLEGPADSSGTAPQRVIPGESRPVSSCCVVRVQIPLEGGPLMPHPTRYTTEPGKALHKPELLVWSHDRQALFLVVSQRRERVNVCVPRRAHPTTLWIEAALRPPLGQRHAPLRQPDAEARGTRGHGTEASAPDIPCELGQAPRHHEHWRPHLDAFVCPKSSHFGAAMVKLVDGNVRDSPCVVVVHKF
mmetsp:Transcript_37752/g.103738  ORF Transcript_37752/g.103738 Transcript_37752/m.103738 type:complete len:264 (+) Transcript_37752:657-1448(+)